MNIYEQVEIWQAEDGVQLFRQMTVPDKAVLLDFGCGFGEYTIALALAHTESEVYAIDKNKKMIKIVQEKAKKHSISNIKFCETDGSLAIPFSDSFADMILMYDFIHGNTSEKLPIRFTLFEEARRVLKKDGVLSIAPFECENLRDSNGKSRKYTLEKLIFEIECSGFQLGERVDGAIHFDYFHSPYHWKKLNGSMPFDYLEKGEILNFIKK